jgi:FixJ family two-component response regulator
MHGKDVAERIATLRTGIRVLYMSGYAQPLLGARQLLEEGVILVEKPFTEQTLRARVREALEGAAPSV